MTNARRFGVATTAARATAVPERTLRLLRAVTRASRRGNPGCVRSAVTGGMASPAPPFGVPHGGRPTSLYAAHFRSGGDHAMRTRRPRWFAVALVVTLALAARPARAETSGTVLEEILEILRKNGQISEVQKKALLERAAREAAQRAQAPWRGPGLASRTSPPIPRAVSGPGSAETSCGSSGRRR
jgi:hypothetical protein